MIRQFDGSAATIKHIKPEIRLQELEARQPMPEFLADSKVKRAVFESEASRFEKVRERSPGPA